MPVSEFYLKGASKAELLKEADLPREKRSHMVRTIYFYFRWGTAERMQHCTKERIMQCDWIERDKKGLVQRVNSRVMGAEAINEVLNDLQSKVEDAEREIRKAGRVATLAELEAVLIKKTEPEPLPSLPPAYPGFYTVFLNRLFLQKKGKGRKNYEKCLYHLINFDPHLTWQDITEEWYMKYLEFLTTKFVNDRTGQPGILNGTIGKDVRVIKDVCKKGRKAGAPVPMDYEDFRKPKYNPRKDPVRMSITEQRLQDLINFDFANPQLIDWDRNSHNPVMYSWRENLAVVIRNIETVRDHYVFSFYTGISHEARVSAMPDQVQDDVDDTGLPIKVLKISRSKTQGGNSIPLNQICLDIIEKYKGRQMGLLPYFCNAQFNRICKRMFRLAGFTKKITLIRWSGDRKIIETFEEWELLGSHSARHSLADHILDSGGDLLLVKDTLGHESIVTSEIYGRGDRLKFNSKILKITEKTPKLKVS